MSSATEILARAHTYVNRKYTTHADERQRSMGLAYVTAEKDDLAREFARFAVNELNKYITDLKKTGTM